MQTGNLNETNVREYYSYWINNLVPRKEDASHIATNFVGLEENLTLALFKVLYEAINCYYEATAIFRFRNKKDIKEFKTLSELLEYENDIWPDVLKNLKVEKNYTEPLKQNLDEKFAVYRINNFSESVALLNGHPIFDGNYYNLCYGNTLYDYELYTHYRERKDFTTINSLLKKKIRCNTMYYIRDLTRPTTYASRMPNCVYHDPEHIKMVLAGLQPSYVPNAYRVNAKHYATMDELFTNNSELQALRPLLVFVP